MNEQNQSTHPVELTLPPVFRVSITLPRHCEEWVRCRR